MPSTSRLARTYDALRVARALDDLPLTRDRFIGSLLAGPRNHAHRDPETEAEWIEFAEKTTLKRLRAQAAAPGGTHAAEGASLGPEGASGGKITSERLLEAALR